MDLKKYIGDKKFYKAVLAIAVPMMIQNGITNFVSLLDNIMVGRLGTEAMSGVSIVNQFIFVFNLLIFGAISAAGIFTAQYHGQGDVDGVRNTFRFKMLINFVAGIIGIAVFALFDDALISSFLHSGSETGDLDLTLAYGKEYLFVMLFGLLPHAVSQAYASTMRETEETMVPMIASVAAVATNFLLNIVLIFGYLGFPALGITGAAIGSSLAELVSLIFFVLYTRISCDRKKYGLDRPASFDRAELRSMMPVCSWTMIQHIISISTWFIFFLYIEHLGERSLAVSNIIRGVSGLLWMILAAFSSTCSTLVSNIIGAGREDKVMSLVKRILKLSYGIVISIAVLFCIFPKAVISIYTDIPELIPATIPSLIVMCSSYLLTVGAMILFNAVSGTGSTKTAFRLELAALGIYTLYCTVIAGILKADVAICWSAEHVYAAALLVLCYIYLRSGRWKNRKV